MRSIRSFAVCRIPDTPRLRGHPCLPPPRLKRKRRCLHRSHTTPLQQRRSAQMHFGGFLQLFGERLDRFARSVRLCFDYFRIREPLPPPLDPFGRCLWECLHCLHYIPHLWRCQYLFVLHLRHFFRDVHRNTAFELRRSLVPQYELAHRKTTASFDGGFCRIRGQEFYCRDP